MTISRLMRNRFLLLTALAAALVSACRVDVEPTVYTAPKVDYSAEGPITVSVGEKVSLDAKVLEGDRLTLGWYVNDVLEASTAHFEYVFKVAGNYTVRFEARNGAGKAEKTFEVTVNDIFKAHLSVGDSTAIRRTQLQTLKVMAIVDAGSGVEHEWQVDGKVESTEAYFNTFVLQDVKTYHVAYHGHNAAGSFSREFDVNVDETRLTMTWSVLDAVVVLNEGETLEIVSTAIYGGSGLQSTWTLDGETISTEKDLSYKFSLSGEHDLKYSAVNAKGETASRSWLVNVISSGYLIDDFENISDLSSWWNRNENQPGVQLVPNPDPTGINTSEHVMSDQVSGTGGTSGYFNLKLSVLASSKGIDVTKYNGVRIKIHLGNSNYYPRIEYGGTKYPPVTPAQRGNKWEILDFRFPSNFASGKNITFRPMLKEDGTNIPSGAVSDTNPRIIYIDDVEFLESNL